MKVVFTCGRFNPPTIGHRKMVEEMQRIGAHDGAAVRLFTTRSHDRRRNPLPCETKLGFLRRLYPDIPVEVAADVFRAAATLADEGFREAILVIGEDRAGLAQTVARYAADLGLDRITPHLVGRTPEAPSATRARVAAQAGDLAAFQALTGAGAALGDELYRAVRLGLGEECRRTRSSTT